MTFTEATVTQDIAREILQDQKSRGFGAEIRISDRERAYLVRLVDQSPVNTSVFNVICRIAREV